MGLLDYSVSEVKVNNMLHFLDISALKIHLSAEAHTALMKFPGYKTDIRGETFVKVIVVMSNLFVE